MRYLRSEACDACEIVSPSEPGAGGWMSAWLRWIPWLVEWIWQPPEPPCEPLGVAPRRFLLCVVRVLDAVQVPPPSAERGPMRLSKLAESCSY